MEIIYIHLNHNIQSDQLFLDEILKHHNGIQYANPY